MDYGYSFVKFSVRDEKVFHLALKILPEKKKREKKEKNVFVTRSEQSREGRSTRRCP